MANFHKTEPLIKVCQDLLSARHGMLYATEKTQNLGQMSPVEILAWATVWLDPTNQRSFARAIGLDTAILPDLRRAFDAVNNACR